MKKMNVQYNKLRDMVENIKGIISDLGEKIGDIQNNAWNEDRDMNYIEQEMYDELDEQSNSLYCCLECIENAMSCLEYYTD